MTSDPELDLIKSRIDPGLTVIEASAGTGKTYSISHLVPRLLLEGVLPDLSKLLLVTYTKDAARELAERVRRVLIQLATNPVTDEKERHPHVTALRLLLSNSEAKARFDCALQNIDLLSVSTINSFCQRTLQQEGSLCGMPVLPEVTNSDAEHLETIVRSLWVEHLSSDPLVAALATAFKWKMSDAQRVIKILRPEPKPQIEPAVLAYAEIRRKIDELCASLSEDASVRTLTDLLKQVPAWNKGIENTDAAFALIEHLKTGATQTLEYWQSIDSAIKLPGKITVKKDDAKKLKAQVEAHRWFTELQELKNLAALLEWALQQQLASAALPRLAALMAHRRLITQDGLISTLHLALHRETPEGIDQSARLATHLAERYHVAIIDESQDTDPKQFAIFQRIFNHGPNPRCLILVGDPKQAIYSFRGADLSTYLAARKTAKACYTLTHTHRAPQPLVHTINSLFDRPVGLHHPDIKFVPAVSALKFDRQLFLHNRPCSRLEAWIVPEADSSLYSASTRQLPEISTRVATAIVDLLKHGEIRTTYLDNRPVEISPISPRDCAVLVADHFQADAMAKALQALAVPVVINSSSDIFDSEEARELLTLLSALLDPRKTRRLRSALATRLLGLDAAKLAALDQIDANGQLPSTIWRNRFEVWNRNWFKRGLIALFASLDGSEVNVTENLALVPLTGERRATNYRHLTDLLLQASREVATRPEEIVRWLGQQIARVEERSQSEERQLQLSSDREAVQIVTMHKAKGLEYPLVFCPYLSASLKKLKKDVVRLPGSGAKGLKPDPDLLINIKLANDALIAGSTQKLMIAQLEERLRLTYVALTRAQVRVWVFSYDNAKGHDESSPLDWILRSADDLKSHPSYSTDWVNTAKKNRSTRHREVLKLLGAQSHADVSKDESTDKTPLITYRDPPVANSQLYTLKAGNAARPNKQEALVAPSVPKSWRITSFSTLTKEKHAHGSLKTPPVDTAGKDSKPAPVLGAPAIAFLGSPGGATVGTIVHDWIEKWDFNYIDPASLDLYLKTTRPPKPREGQPAWSDALKELFDTLRSIRLPGCAGTPLHELCPEPHGSEWHFHLPLADSLTVGAIARCFEDYADPAHRPYADSLKTLPEEKFQGLLQGYIDRLARQGTAWGVIDWKTNHLGTSLSGYDESALLRCAMKDHYLLQTHLYLVALRRYLRAFGLQGQGISGAWLVFLRAIAKDDTRGVLHINPPEAMLNALDELFAPARN